MILIPLDDRPASTQFAQMIGSIAGTSVETPPTTTLGKFLTPGDPDAILDWLEGKDLRQYQAVVASPEMFCYGGLIASRTNRTSYSTALRRLKRFEEIRARAPKTPFYGFSAIMRLAPTATRASAGYRAAINDLIQLKAQVIGEPSPEQKAKAERLRRRIPSGAIDDYYAARRRNLNVQLQLLEQSSRGVWDYLILGQDDAQPKGPHVAETTRLSELCRRLDLARKLYFCEGIDQHGNVLASRALLKMKDWTPRVRVVYADEIGKGKIAPFESDRVEESLLDQLVASGATPVQVALFADYTLFVNTPDPRPAAFERFLAQLTSDLDQGFPVAVADINLGVSGTGDPRLFDALSSSGRAMKLLGYAGWNTAGNTMGTAIPAANIYLLARREAMDPLACELNQRAFLLHRMVNDFEYHRYTRPLAYQLGSSLGQPKEEVYGEPFRSVNAFVQQDLKVRLEETFQSQFAGRTFFAGSREYRIKALRDVEISLPWPRAYEVKLGFSVQAVPVE